MAITYNPNNERIKSKYFIWEREANGKSSKTIDSIRKALIRYEEYTKLQCFKTFNHKKAIEFKAHLFKEKNKKGRPLSASTIASTLRPLQVFLKWLALQPGFKSRIHFPDIEFLNLSEKDKRKIQSTKLKVFPSPQQIRQAISTITPSSEINRRNRALIAFTFATGIRDGAIIGLKLKHINIEERYVIQDPKEVNTKFGKCINTKFFPVGDDIHQIVKEWVNFLRVDKLFNESDPLFPKEMLIHDDQMCFQGGRLSREHWRGASGVRGVFKHAFESADLSYFSPHKFRDTLSALGRKLCNITEEQMAWAKNMGHESPLTTFSTYGGFTPEQQFEVMEKLYTKPLEGASVEPPLTMSSLRRLLSMTGDE